MKRSKKHVSGSVLSIQEAEEAIKRRFLEEGFKGELQYDPTKVIENERWWFIPCGWIGCFGCIISKSDGYVNWLGSSSTITLDDCFWGHDHGLFCDLVDFFFAPDTDLGLVARLILRFKHMKANASGVLPKESVWYGDGEIAAAVSNQFPTFSRHDVWHAIPEIRTAFEKDGLRFKSILSVPSLSVNGIVISFMTRRARFAEYDNNG